MKLSTLKYSLMDAFKSLKRNRTLTTASIATVTATLFILGVFILIILDGKQVLNDVQSKVELQVFLKDDININQEMDIESKIKSVKDVKEVVFEGKEQALEKLKNQFGDKSSNLAEGIDKGAMPNSYIVKVNKPEVITEVVASIKDMPGIEKIRDERALVEKLVKVVNTVKWIGVVLFVILIGVSLFLIGNTIKITVYSRRREIGIMKYIGATDWYIRWPFIMEGMVIGILGAVVSTVLLYYGYKAAFSKVTLGFITLKLIPPIYIFTNVIWAFLGAGLLIGAVGSIVAIRKFLIV